jgi:hypothetical protein
MHAFHHIDAGNSVKCRNACRVSRKPDILVYEHINIKENQIYDHEMY